MSDSILLWNAVALEADRASHTNGQGERAQPVEHGALWVHQADVANEFHVRCSSIPRWG